MRIKKLFISIPLTLIAVVLVGWLAAPTVQAHDGVASGTCQGGVQWSYTQYEKADVNSITVTIDGTVRYHDGDFKASDTGTIATDKTQPHTWKVDVDAPGTQFDKHPSGSYAACVVATTTTVAATTTTTTLPLSTTTVPQITVPVATTVPEPPTTTLVAVDIPPVPCPYNPTVPAGSPLCAPPSTVSDVAVLVPANPPLPATGTGDTIMIVAAGCIIVGAYLIVRGRRVR